MLNYIDLVRISLDYITNSDEEQGLANSFAYICQFLQENPENLSWRAKNSQPDLNTEIGIRILAQKYFNSYRKSDFPAIPNTIPDEIVGIVMQAAYNYSPEDYIRIKEEHQKAMCAENCVGALLERYIDSVLRKEGWNWCCGDFVRAIDFIRKVNDNEWELLQIKNRDNSENSSSSAIRKGTIIQKWFRSYSRSGATNWNNLPQSMKGYLLNEEDYINFVRQYLKNEKIRLNKG